MNLLEKIQLLKANASSDKLRPGELTVRQWAKKWRMSPQRAGVHLNTAFRVGLMTRRSVQIVTESSLGRRAFAYQEKKGSV